ncbi:MAG: type I DNA topoisomerase [Kiritimatiellaeota bacterium]|nr:type I DNA topoisomerase [Kiritimatiellota bacterium]
MIAELQAAAKGMDTIYLAPDPDREGEAIAWHLMALLKKAVPADRFLRVTYNEITEQAIRKALAHPGKIDLQRVDSQQARRVLDRLVGYKVSPLLWRQVRGASSAGRVQSVALRLVCEREVAIENFKPEEFWLLGARVRKQAAPVDPFEIRLAKINDGKADIKSDEQARTIQADLDGRALRVAAVINRELAKRAPPPFITSTLQQAGSSVYGLSPAITMKIAQKLYEGVDLPGGEHVGLITYMRTDSLAVAREAQAACREFIAHHFGVPFLPDRAPVFKSRASAQEAHECIRPTSVQRTPDAVAAMLPPDEAKLYRLIWQRFVASQMAAAKIAQRTAEIEAPPPAGRTSTYLFRATASEVTFPGYMKVTGVLEERERKNDKENGEEAEVDRLPPLAVGEMLDLLEWLTQQKFTQPPARFTEASLVQALEENGVGRPSTYASIIATLLNRRYAEKDKRALKPTPVGRQTNDFLVRHLNELFDVKFTAGMELLLDEVEEGKVEWHEMMEKFYRQFIGWLDVAKTRGAEPEKVQKLLGLLARMTAWAPPTPRGKKMYSDEGFVQSIREQVASGQGVSDRQWVALQKLACRYQDSVPELKHAAAELGLTAELAAASQPREPASVATLRKIELLKPVTFGTPRKFGRRTFNDQTFFESLRQQAEGGRGLSEKQIGVLDKMLRKYAEQIPNFEAVAGELGLTAPVTGAEDAETGRLVAWFRHVKEWRAPVQRGRRLWDDKEFVQSLSHQYAQNRRLSPKQVASLRKMIKYYVSQLPPEAAAAMPPPAPKADDAPTPPGGVT